MGVRRKGGKPQGPGQPNKQQKAWMIKSKSVKRKG